jgi:hypothetical protein
VYIECIIRYWSRLLKSTEKNYSPTEKEVLALCDGPVKFQPIIEGEVTTAITDHSVLTWSHTFQNVNRRLRVWNLMYSAFLSCSMHNGRLSCQYPTSTLQSLQQNSALASATVLAELVLPYRTTAQFQ